MSMAGVGQNFERAVLIKMIIGVTYFVWYVGNFTQYIRGCLHEPYREGWP